MALTPVQIEYDLSGIASPKMYILDPSGSSAVALNNSGAGDAVTLTTQGYHAYEAEISENITGLQRVVILSGSTPIVDGWVYLADTTDRVYVEDTVAGALAASNQTAVLAAIPSAADIEAALVNDGDATAFLQAVADKIASDLTSGDVTAAAIASAVRTNLATELARIDVAISSVAGGDASAANQNTILAKMLKYNQLITRKDAAIKTDNAVELAEINADGGSGTGAYDNAVHSQEAAGDGVTTINDTLVNTNVTVISHQKPGGAITLVRGDTYKAANNRRLEWTNEDGTGWPADLTGATVKFSAVRTTEVAGGDTSAVAADKKIIATGSVIQATAPNQMVAVELSPTDTDKEEGLYEYDVEVTLASNITTLVTTAVSEQEAPVFASPEKVIKKLEILPHYTQ